MRPARAKNYGEPISTAGWAWCHTSNPSYTSPRQNLETLSKIQLKQKRAGCVAQVAECLPSKLKALSSSPRTTMFLLCPMLAMYYFQARDTLSNHPLHHVCHRYLLLGVNALLSSPQHPLLPP
jgi:hypothetical protein